jgi:hypothetical protein
MKNWISAGVLAILAIATQAQTTCVDPLACNFTQLGECEFLDDNGMPCVTEGCAIPGACNFNPEADINDGSCEFTSCLGCTDEAACNYDPEAVYLDLSCIYFVDCNGVCGGDWIEDECGNCYPLVAESGEMVFSFSGEAEEFEVPIGVYQLSVELYGASGGPGLNTTGGAGGRSSGVIETLPGELLYVFVGGSGGSVSQGWNGGGLGGIDTGGGQNGGGGGGASDVRSGGYDWEHRIIVAGGGGGGGRDGSTGDGGGLIGGESSNYDTGYGGTGGTQTVGGAAYSTSRGATHGEIGLGGHGSTGYDAAGGGGGGGGWYGGGGGTSTQNHGSGYSGGGGGGSSYFDELRVSEFVTNGGLHQGDGVVIFSWEGQSAPICELGCTVAAACNYEVQATNDDGSCDFCFCGPGTEYDIELGQCMIVNGSPDINGDGCTNLGDLLDLLSGYGTCED